MTAGDLVVVLAAVFLSLGFTALVVAVMRVLDALRELRAEVTDLRVETDRLMEQLIATTEGARDVVDEARGDLDRFDRVLGSAEAIGDAVSGRVARTAYSAPAIKAAGVARGMSRGLARLRGHSNGRTIEPGAGRGVVDLDIPRESRSARRGRRA